MENKDRQSDGLYDLVSRLWKDESQNLSDKYAQFYAYWNGDFKSDNASLKDQHKTLCNVVKRVIEVKTASALDARFTAEVVPVLNSFASLQRIQDMKDYADVLNDEVRNIERDNKTDILDEIIMRRGLICGLSPDQVVWDTAKRAEGEVKITAIEPGNFRWDKNAKRVDDCTFHAYGIELNPSLVKKRYANNDPEIIEKIDAISKTKEEKPRTTAKGVVNVSTNAGASQAYVYDTQGITTGNVVKLVVMFILDDSVYEPESSDDGEAKEVKEESKSLYPNGRMIVFCPEDPSKMIFDDKPAPAAFKSLGNIDIFRPMDTGEIAGKGDVEDLMAIQDAINGVYNRLRLCIKQYIGTFLFPQDLKGIVKEGEFVQNPITFVESLQLLGADRTPSFITNNNIEQAIKLLDLIARYEQEAYRTARINETLLSGEQANGVTSAAQVDALQQSPMESIRSIQRNFKQYVIDRTEKIINLIQENYNVQRLVELSTGINGADYAQFSHDDGQSKITLMTRAGKAVKEILIDANWQFRVEVSAGTEIPRSRRETAMLVDKLAASPIMNSGNIPMIDMYLTAQDFPQRRAVIQLMTQQQQAAANKKYTMQDVMMSPALSKSLSEMIDSLSKAGMTTTISQILQHLGVVGEADTLATAPIQSVASKADVLDVAATTPGKVASHDTTDTHGRIIAGSIIDKHLEKHNPQFGV